MKPANQLSGEAIASRLVGLMHGDNGPALFMEQYADCVEKAAELDDLSFVRMGREAEAFEEGFRHFVAEFPGAPAVTIPEGELFDIGVYLARVDTELRRSLLKRWAGIIRTKACQYQHLNLNKGDLRMSEIKAVITSLQESGLVVQGLTIDQIESMVKNDPRPVKEQFIALMATGRAYGIYFYQDQAGFDRDEFARKLGELGFGKNEAMMVLSNLRPTPTPELSSLGDRD